MTITLMLPDDIAQHPDPGREALAMEGYRSGALTAYQTRLPLGLRLGMNWMCFSKNHDVWEDTYSLENLQQDRQTFTLLDKKAGKQQYP